MRVCSRLFTTVKHPLQSSRPSRLSYCGMWGWWLKYMRNIWWLKYMKYEEAWQINYIVDHTNLPRQLLHAYSGVKNRWMARDVPCASHHFLEHQLGVWRHVVIWYPRKNSVNNETNFKDVSQSHLFQRAWYWVGIKFPVMQHPVGNLNDRMDC